MKGDESSRRMAPYVSAAALSEFFDHIRYVSTPKKVDAGLLLDYGTSKGNVFALRSALKFLGLIDDQGKPTPAFSSLQVMGEEFNKNLREIVTKAYADLFHKLDVSRDSREHIRNYFSRNYSPSQSLKATILFLDLCGEAGIPTVAESSRESKPIESKESKKVSKHIRKKDVSVNKNVDSIQTNESDEAISTESLTPPSSQQGGIIIHIDSKDIAAMNQQQIEALFNGLSKLKNLEKEKV